MIAISNLKLAPGADEARLLQLAAGALKVPPQDIPALRIRKKSLDALTTPTLPPAGARPGGAPPHAAPAAAAAPRSCRTRPIPSRTSRRRRRAP